MAESGNGHAVGVHVVVTGAAGFVGSHLCEALLGDGHTVTGIDCFTDFYPRSVKRANLAGLVGQPGFDLHPLDLRTDRLEPVLDGANVVINEAAMPGLRGGRETADAYRSYNVLAAARLTKACRDTGVGRFLQASTSSVYGRNAVGDESRATDPASPYALSKFAAERLLLCERAANDVAVVILRYFSVYGPRQRPDMACHRFITALMEREEITVFGDGLQTRSSTYVDDCVRGTMQAMRGGEPGEIYNVAGAESVTLMHVIALIANELGVVPRVRFQAPRRGDQRRTLGDTTKAAAAFGYAARVPIAEGIRRQVAWHVDSRADMLLPG
jgi:nucleoside-diphosphate-sugar epimerase